MTNDEILAALHYLIGSHYVPSVKQYITDLTGRTRVVGPNDTQTRDMDPKRITIRVTGDTIESFTFG